jgi:peroxiredoxin 2/4
MKKIIFVVLLAFSMSQVRAQWEYETHEVQKPKEDRHFRIPLIGETAPSFVAQSTNGEINFPSDYGRKWKVLFSHPQDFTPVCTSELLELANLQTEFEKLGAELVCISADALDTHVQWKKAMEGITYKDREPVKIKFPIIDDENLAVSKMYGMIHPETNTHRDVRGVFIINPDDVIQAIYFYPMQVGRNTDELVRVLTALKTTYKEKVMTPANWKAGNDVLIPYPPREVETNPQAVPEGYYNLSWFMWYKKANN